MKKFVTKIAAISMTATLVIGCMADTAFASGNIDAETETPVDQEEDADWSEEVLNEEAVTEDLEVDEYLDDSEIEVEEIEDTDLETEDQTEEPVEEDLIDENEYAIATLAAALDTPMLQSATASPGAITVKWSSVSGATGYRVFRKTENGSWGNIGLTSTTDYTDSTVEIGTTYIYTVRAYKGDQETALANAYSTTYWSDYDKTGVSAKATIALDTPVLQSASAKDGKITVTWNSVDGATGYRVFRKPSGGSWSNIGLTTDLSYTDSGADIGTTYIYTVRAYKGEQDTALANAYSASYWSDYDSKGVSAKASACLSTPTLKSASGSSGSTKIEWSSVSGATGYRVFRKPSGGSWSNIGLTTSTTYTDSSVDIGTTYIYTVRAYKGEQSTAVANAYKAAYWSDYDSKGVSAKGTSALSTPTLKSASGSSGSTTITWNSVSGATGYRVFRKPSGGSWSNIGLSTTTSYTDNSVDIGTTYIYTVRAYKGEQSTALANCYKGAYWSGYDSTGVSAKGTSALSTPTLKSATGSSGSTKIEWSSVSGATGYRVFRKTSGGSWSNIGLTTSTTYTDSSVDVGTTYIYTVRAYKGSQSTALANCYKGAYWSDYDSKGVSAKGTSALSTPKLKSATGSSGSTKIEWSSVSGATGYRVFRKPSGGSWSNIGLTTSTTYTDSSVDVGTTYIYTVRAYKGSQSTALNNCYKGAYWSDYDSTGVSAKGTSALSTPSLQSASVTDGLVTVSWNAVSGATGYRVFRKKSGGSWGNIGLTTSTSYTDETAGSGATYYYTVRAYKGDQATALANCYKGAYWSDYESPGVVAVVISELYASMSAISWDPLTYTLSWNAVSGASKYSVYRKTYGGDWKKLADTSSTSYKDYSGNYDTTYYYAIRCINSSGNYFGDYIYNSSGSDVVSYALQFVGNPYVYGGTSLTNGCDCSGFVMQVYGHFGVSMPHSSFSQAEAGKSVSYSNAQPGDLIFYYSSGTSGGHIGIYIGNGQMVHAQNENTGICVTNVNTSRSGFTVRRIF